MKKLFTGLAMVLLASTVLAQEYILGTDADQALQSAESIPYVQEFGGLEQISLREHDGHPYWFIEKTRSDGEVLDIWVDTSTGGVTKINTVGDTGATLQYSSQDELDYMQYAKGISERMYTRDVRFSSTDALEIAQRIPYVRDFGILDDTNLVQKEGRLFWNLKFTGSDGNSLNVRIDAKSGIVMGVDPEWYDVQHSIEPLSNKEKLVVDFEVYGQGLSREEFDRKVRVTSDTAIKIVDNLKLSQDEPVQEISLQSDHGILVWQVLKGADEPDAVFWVNAHDGVILKADTDLIDVLEAEQ